MFTCREHFSAFKSNEQLKLFEISIVYNCWMRQNLFLQNETLLLDIIRRLKSNLTGLIDVIQIKIR